VDAYNSWSESFLFTEQGLSVFNDVTNAVSLDFQTTAASALTPSVAAKTNAGLTITQGGHPLSIIAAGDPSFSTNFPGGPWGFQQAASALHEKNVTFTSLYNQPIDIQHISYSFQPELGPKATTNVFEFGGVYVTSAYDAEQQITLTGYSGKYIV